MRVALVANPRAGRGPPPVAAVTEALSQAGAEVTLFGGPGADFTAEARRAAQECDVVAAMGGDGTVNSVASALAGGSTPMLVLPAGTLNHFARDLGVPRDLVEAALLVRDGRRRNVDVGEVNGRVFVNTSSIGAYPFAVALREQLRLLGVRGKWRAMARASLVTFRLFPTLHVRLAGDIGELEVETPLVFVGNDVYAGEGLGALRRARLDDGRLCLITAEVTSPPEVLRLALLAALGRLHTSPAVWRGEPTEITVGAARRSLLVSLDGEVVRLRPPLRYRSRPGALAVFAPAVPVNAGC
jgi:diacylglycerol kinase family enzyme